MLIKLNSCLKQALTHYTVVPAEFGNYVKGVTIHTVDKWRNKLLIIVCSAERKCSICNGMLENRSSSSCDSEHQHLLHQCTDTKLVFRASYHVRYRINQTCMVFDDKYQVLAFLHNRHTINTWKRVPSNKKVVLTPEIKYDICNCTFCPVHQS